MFPKPVRKELASELLATAGIESETRPFLLTVSEFGQICKVYMDICNKNPDYMKYNHREQKSNDEWPESEAINSDSSGENIIMLND